MKATLCIAKPRPFLTPSHLPLKPRILRSGLGLIAVGLLSSGCASTGAAPEPAWPEQPSPSYPSPAQADSAAQPPLMEESPQESKSLDDIAASSSLAKEYKGKKALDTLEGKASYYADSLAGNHTANGDIYDPQAFTAAHKKLEFGTVVRVIREDTGASTYVRINDRGPFGDAERIIDLSKAAATELEMMKAGVVKVRVEILETPQEKK